jgi:serine/threonine protein phosphatase 1
MLRKIKKLFAKPPSATNFDAPIAIGRPTYAIGDIHGRHDLLMRLLPMIEADADEAALENPRVVFLGDYVDRGEQSREVLEALTAMKAEVGENIVFLKGNHEAMMLEFLAAPEDAAAIWLRNGGLQTLMSFGVGGVTPSTRGEEAIAARDKLRDEIGDSLDFLHTLDLTFRDGGVAFTHAGADPALPLDMQRESNLLWGARDFLTTPRADGLWVVHGHIVEDEPYARDGRIAVDTGACFTGRLTAARIWDGEVVFLTT